MKTVETKTPAQVGLSVIVCSGPRGTVRDDWPCIEYTVQLQDERSRPIWTGEYRLGVGHVKWPRKSEDYPDARSGVYFTQDEGYCLNTIRMKPGAQIANKQLWADTAAKLAKAQKTTPKLEAVCHSLLSDGAAFFDGQRFEDWAGDFGYSADSIKAKETFEACDKIGRDLSRALSRDEIESLREWASNY